MPIQFDNDQVDVSRVDDRRGGGGGGLAIGGGASVVGLVIYLIVSLLGGDPGQLQLPAAGGNATGGQGATGAESAQQLADRCNAAGALATYTDCRLIKTFNVADTVWQQEFADRRLTYASPQFAFFSGSVQTACGPANAQMGPFYCPGDQEIYFEVAFLEELQQRFGATGQFAQAYIVAHEFGHHLQTLLGTERSVRAAQQRNPAQANRYSIALELQADCYAGVWTTLADRTTGNGIALSQDNIDEAITAAEAVGDDRIQEKVSGRVSPESWTHGSAAQRKQWFLTGAQTADLTRCTSVS